MLRLWLQNPSWLPVDFAGRGISEVVLADRPKASAVYHIVNPDVTASWDDILLGLQRAGLKFNKVQPQEWVDQLGASDADPLQNPAVKLAVSLFHLLDRRGGAEPWCSRSSVCGTRT